MRDWRETVRGAADLALAGLLVTLAALPVLTAGAAFAAGSAAVHHLVTHGSWPDAPRSWAVFRRALVPGALATVVALTVGGLLVLDLAALRSGAVPGGPAVLAVTALVALALAGLAGMFVVELGARSPHPDDLAVPAPTSRTSGASEQPKLQDRPLERPADGRGWGPGGIWRAAWSAAVSTAARRPATLAAAAGVVALVALLALLVHPVLVATLPGYALFALHTLHARRPTPSILHFPPRS